MTSTVRNQHAPITDDTFSAYSSVLSLGELENLIALERLSLYNRGKPCGALALQRHLQRLGVSPVPSLYKIGKILIVRCLTNGQTGYYPEDYQ